MNSVVSGYRPQDASAVSGASGKKRQPWSAEADAEGVWRRAPASPGQRRFWLMDQLHPGDPALNIAVRWRLQGTVRIDDLERALQTIIERHETLRTVFEIEDGEPVQRILPPPTFAPQIPVIDLSRLSAADADMEAERLARLEAQRGFSLATAPLLRATLLRIDANTAILLLTLHHIVGDGWSMGVLAQELSEICAARHEQRPVQLPELTVSYAEYSEWQAEYQTDPAAAEGAAFWDRTLRGMQPFRLSPDRVSALHATAASGELLSLSLPDGLGILLGRLARRHGCTMFTVVSAALTAVLHRYSGVTDIGIGTQVPGRDEVELEPLIGMFGNTLVLRHDLSGDPTFAELLARTRATVTAAFAHQDTPLEKVIEVLRPPRERGRGTLFSISLMVNPALVQDPDCGSFRLTDLPSVSPGTMYDLSFHMVEHAQGWRVSCEYNIEAFACTTVARLLRHLSAVLQTVAVDADQRLASLPIPAVAGLRARIGRDDDQSPDEAAVSVTTTTTAATDVEVRLAAIWRVVLGVAQLERDANFFELGGHSLLAAKLLARVEAEFGKRISLAAMFHAPTLDGMVALIGSDRSAGDSDPRLPKVDADGGREYDFRQVVRLQSAGSRQPLIALNNTGIYYGLSRQLGADQPFVSLQVFDPSIPDQQLPQSFEAIATEYVRLILRLQPQGPYALLGWCVAGTLAFEVARQLRAGGHPVSQLFLLDTWVPGYLAQLPKGRALLASASHRWQSLGLDWARLRSGRQPWREFLANRPSLQRMLRWLGVAAPEVEPEVDAAGRPLAAEHYDQWLLTYLQRMVSSYRPGPYDGRVVLFRSAEQPGGRFLDAAMGWGLHVADGVEVQEVQGDHFSMFRNGGVRQLADRIARSLSSAVRRT